MPSYLGGGDQDGDLYNVTAMPELLPRVNYEPAAYDPAPKKLLDRPSTIDDIADFVADYVNSDVRLQSLCSPRCSLSSSVSLGSWSSRDDLASDR